ncbi:MAG TPA: DUF4173 domain-containing protein, partial [Blastocatellia bacterium]|nr:DUF4173 domain-containing protein [Blastocatellia bacterium]
MEKSLFDSEAEDSEPAARTELVQILRSGAVTGMSERSVLALKTFAVSFLVGVVVDALLRNTRPGLNVPILAAVLIAAAMWLAREGRVNPSRASRVVLPALMVFAAAFAWRDSATLKILDAVALFAMLSVAFSSCGAYRARLSSITDYLFNGITVLLNTLVGSLSLALREVEWRTIRRGRTWRVGLSLASGAALAVPVLLVFGTLLASADPVFARGMREAVRLQPETLASHLLFAGPIAWIAAGFFRGALTSTQSPITPRPRPSFLSLGAVQVATLLGLVDLLFLGFVIVQLGYFFGGAERVEATVGLTYAEYARRGFFELVAVTALALPLLLGSHWLLRKRSSRDEVVYRWLAGIMLVLLLVIMASALRRMRLYQSEYGLTELRLYTTAFMLWLGVVFVWFALTVLYGRRERFATGAGIAALAIILALNALNPDAFIVRTNMSNIRSGYVFDAQYAASLSSDAVPALVERLDSLGE